MMTDVAKQEFQNIIWDYYSKHGRNDLPWRQPEASNTFDPYKIMVNEIMLQQTQVNRVIDKYAEFLEQFPAQQALAEAELGTVLRMWSGLGYNRRAKFLHQAAQRIVQDFAGMFPDSLEELVSLPGIGKNTAGAILAYAFNQPSLFIETNIRTVYIHHFFNDQYEISDTEILNLLSITIDNEHPREWYWALMDYGSYLKKTGVRRNHQSKHYTKQSKFEGSKRQIRGKVLRQLGDQAKTRAQISQHIKDDRLQAVLEDLLKEGLIYERNNKLTL